MAVALTGARTFDGAAFHDGKAVIIEGKRIREVCAAEAIPSGLDVIQLKGGILAPGFIDVQVNGGGGALLNDDPTPATVRRIADAHRAFGTVAMLPTVITDAPEILDAAIAAVRDAKCASILGIHIEGPFLDERRKGAHDPAFIRALTDADVAHIAGADCGIKMLTLAPSRVAPAHVRRLAEAGVLVSLGHSEATYDEAMASLAAGARAFTHVFNAMSQMTGRAPGMAGACLSDAESYCGLIADGHHVHDAAMKLAIAAKGPERVMLVTDAMPSAANGPDAFSLQGRRVTKQSGRLELEDGTLAGSDLTMDAAVRYCVNKLGIALEDALRMASLTPAAFLRREHELGRIAPGYLASLVHLDEDLRVKQTWIEGT
jgi:N-acetylglucosamine-6-phosphate deacetylase